MTEMVNIDTSSEHVEADSTSAPRDFEGEAKKQGWTPKDDFKGDPTRWVDAETFVKRADEVMPLLKKQNEGLKRDLDEMKRTLRQASKHFEASEQRAYQRALSDLEAKHTAAVEVGDVTKASAIVKEMRDLPTPEIVEVPDDGKPNQDQLRAELAEWVEKTGWYGTDSDRTTYADLQANLMGKAESWTGGQKAWLEELGKRVERKFAEVKPSPTNGGGNRPAPRAGGKTFADLPPQAKALCDKWVRSGIIKDRETYVKSYQFD